MFWGNGLMGRRRLFRMSKRSQNQGVNMLQKLTAGVYLLRLDIWFVHVWSTGKHKTSEKRGGGLPALWSDDGFWGPVFRQAGRPLPISAGAAMWGGLVMRIEYGWLQTARNRWFPSWKLGVLASKKRTSSYRVRRIFCKLRSSPHGI